MFDNIVKKIQELKTAKDEIDGHVWSIFERYLKQEKILFNYPEGWEVRDNHIHFYGEDGCKGCYDSMSLDIPFKFFENPDIEFDILKKQKETEANAEAAKIKAEQDNRDRKEYERSIYGLIP